MPTNQATVASTTTPVLPAGVPNKCTDPYYPVERPQRNIPAAEEGNYVIFPDKPKQVITGMGFEIQSDSINSGNQGLPEHHSSVPHDLTPGERNRFYQEMLSGFRYCRLAGGLFWRGTDREEKHLQPRWPEQLTEIREMIDQSGIESVSMEYWSPAPYWKANRKYTGKDGTENILRCFGKDFANDPEYKGDINRFLNDFGDALCKDIKTLENQGIKVSMWGLQNEPCHDTQYSSCKYTPEQFTKAFLAVAPKIRALDPKIWILSDTINLKTIEPILKTPEHLHLIDAWVVHEIGWESQSVKPLPEPFPKKPFFQNEYEYLYGPTSPARCLNTVQSIMNWYQIAESPTWFWIHVLKPIKNLEASGFSLGFWRPMNEEKENPDFPGLKQGHWTWNKYNWHAVASFLKHMPWDCQCVELEEENPDDDLRIFAFKKPNGKLTIVLSNRSFGDHTFKLNTNVKGARFKGYRYTPDDAGVNFMGSDIGELTGTIISPKVPDMSWEFWEQQ